MNGELTKKRLVFWCGDVPSTLGEWKSRMIGLVSHLYASTLHLPFRKAGEKLICDIRSMSGGDEGCFACEAHKFCDTILTPSQEQAIAYAITSGKNWRCDAFPLEASHQKGALHEPIESLLALEVYNGASHS